MKQTHRVSAGITICYFGLYIIIALSFLIRQPFGSPPDEYNRYRIPQYIAENGTLPNGYDESIRIPGYGFSYAFQPILPYIFQGWVMRFVGLFTESPEALVYAARFVNFLLGLIMAFFVLLLAKKWFRKACWQWLFSFLVTFLPQAIFIHTYVNTDSCCMLSTALMLYGLTCGLHDGFHWRSTGIMVLGIILCALSYYNAYGFILSCILMFTGYFISWHDRKVKFELKAFWKKSLLIAVPVLLGISWWFIRSAYLYDGDFLGLKSRDFCASLYANEDLLPANRITWKSLGYSVWDMLLHSDFLILSDLSFIGIFGAMTIITSIWIYRFYRVLFFAGVVFCAVIPSKGEEAAEDGAMQLRGRKWFNRFFHVNMIFCIMMPLILSISYSYTTDYQPQGRYLLPALIPLAYYCVRGFEKFLSRLGGWLTRKGLRADKWSMGEIGIISLICLVIAICLVVSVYGYVFPYYAVNPAG